MDTLNFDGRFTVATMPGVAFWLDRFATRTVEHVGDSYCAECGLLVDANGNHLVPDRYIGDVDHDADVTADVTYDEEPDETMVVAVMVGDDREHLVSVDDLTEISEDDYCPGCGQIGCGH